MADSLTAHTEISSDVLVVGGGPAGSTIAALLAERGFDVVVAEKDRHPRFHIGESLLPLNLPLFERLGLSEQIAAIGMPKFGAEFVSPQHEKSVTYEFAGAWHKDRPHAYQVRRSVFDHLLLKNAVAKGARLFEECRVLEVDFPEGEGGGVIAEAQVGEGEVLSFKARFLVDASGRDTFLANRFNIKNRNRQHESAALFGHFTGARRLQGRAEGNISICWFEHGWFWFIPLADGTTSVGAVCRPPYFKTRKSDLRTFFMETIAQCPEVAQRLKDATLASEVIATGNYSYRARQMMGERYLMVGDAYAFIDPMFSSGVYLAMNSGFLGAETVEAILRDPARAGIARRRFDSEIRRGLDTFSWFIYRATAPSFRALFMAPRNIFRVVEALISLLSGDVFGRAPIGPSLAAFKLF
ncbi:MAG TPA: NAD(P)/FAD-dependent oxidoreductase, partial [Stellaceae bacterium]|nr:NAD(P)/FAD-dependent oxidoreductase [Stellaceae bacterium]